MITLTPPETRLGAGWVKLDLLAHGVELDPSVFCLGRLAPRFAARKNFYNTPVWQTTDVPLPQELRVGGLVVGLNSYGSSPWLLSRNPEDALFTLERVDTGFRLHPELILDLEVFASDLGVARVANLYGGAALAFFSPRNCYFFKDGTQCGFCSLDGTAEETKEFKSVLSEGDVRQTVRAALASDGPRIEQVMIVGGNMRDLDRGFRHHVTLAAAAADEIEQAGKAEVVSIHIATMPPRDLRLIELLRRFSNVHVMFNLEVWDRETFSKVCPGKQRDYGRDGMLSALECLRDTIGTYRAHSVLVTGLEPAETTVAGATALAEMGISPIINVYHSDRHSRFGLGDRPSFLRLCEVARGLQGLYGKFPLLPYWRRCGRNSIDAEAERGLFREPIPAFLK